MHIYVCTTDESLQSGYQVPPRPSSLLGATGVLLACVEQRRVSVRPHSVT